VVEAPRSRSGVRTEARFLETNYDATATTAACGIKLTTMTMTSFMIIPISLFEAERRYSTLDRRMAFVGRRRWAWIGAYSEGDVSAFVGLLLAFDGIFEVSIMIISNALYASPLLYS
jgi:hypothetical protein